MKYTLSLRDDQLLELKAAMVHQKGHERFAYLFCNLAVTNRELRLIVKEVQEAESKWVTNSSPTHVSVSSQSFVRALAKADRDKMSLVIVHSHPSGVTKFSAQDNAEEKAFFKTAYLRAPQGMHGSLIFVGEGPNRLVGRVWLSDGKICMIDKIRVVGRRLRLFEPKGEGKIMNSWADRQVLAFGPETQQLLTRLHVGIVGAGGTGSSVLEQLIRIGVGELTVIDDQKLEDTNVTRLYGSRMADVGRPKVEIIKRLAEKIGLGTKINAINGSVCDKDVAEQLRDCDVVFGCTDDSLGRSILNRLAMWYYIPVIDTAVKIDSTSGIINDITGRVTLLIPGARCLSCRGRISAENISAESQRRSNPVLYQQRVKQHYANELDQSDPSIIMFTTGVAARAVAELMHMLTGFMGGERQTTEFLERFHEASTGRNSTSPDPQCSLCGSSTNWGNADETNFLGMLF